MTKTCYLPSCHKKEGDDVSFFTFPTHIFDCLAWCSALGITFAPELIQNTRHLCHLHFSPTSYKSTVKRTLHSGATPAKNSAHSILRTPLLAVPTNIQPISPSTNRDRATITELRQKLKHSQDALYYYKNKKQKDPEIDYTAILQKFPNSKDVARFIEMQIRRHNSKTAQHYTDEEKTFAITMYYATGAKGYSWFKGLGFKLPSIKSIQKWVGMLRILPGYCNETIDCLKQSVLGMNEKERDCVISLDETTIKKLVQYNKYWDILEGIETYRIDTNQMRPADKTLVFMVRGLNTSWKSALSYHHSQSGMPSEKLEEILVRTIKDLHRIGLRVRAVVVDQGATNIGLFRLLNTTLEDPYFVIEGKKIYALYDPPHLMKCFRNNLEKYGCSFYCEVANDPSLHDMIGETSDQLMIAEWSQLREAYLSDLSGTSRVMPKLTDKHLDLENFSKMKVKLATQVLSKSVAKGIQLMVRDGLLKREALGFANLAEKLNDLFDIMNISEKTSANPLKSGENSFNHIPKLLNYAKWISTIKFRTNQHIPTLKNFQQTCQAMSMLLTDLQVEGYRYVLTRRIQSDFLEHFFSFLKYKIGSASTPTAVQFRQSFRYCFISNLIKSPLGANCENFDEGDTLEESMTKLHYIMTLKKQTTINAPYDRTNIAAYDLESEGEDEFESGSEDSNDEARVNPNTNTFFDGIQSAETNSASENGALIVGTWAVKSVIRSSKCDQCSAELLEFLQDRPEEELASQERLLFDKSFSPSDFTNGKELGYGHLLCSNYHPFVLAVGELFKNATFKSQNSYGTAVSRNIARELKKDPRIYNFLNDISVPDDCKVHRESILKLLIRTKLYNLLRELNGFSERSLEWTK